MFARRVREAEKDAKDHDYVLEHIEHSDVLAEVELAISTAKDRLKDLLAQARAERIASELEHPVWRETPRATVHDPAETTASRFFDALTVRGAGYTT
ncbi:hypothetical protein [Mesorhizobium onobrychidis]|uniref:Uncharacterized protein n=1 Tax=Mesorhizobium onobrychidis TaxID=2775404 RepID=A0ABY5QWF7_9HYPH|nr:hypothetical protein [Mesorhizobium onobrychidis]UVC15546.1 hypothetical protein IHQ72_34915 [Mesorhizobium onobrychidis]